MSRRSLVVAFVVASALGCNNEKEKPTPTPSATAPAKSAEVTPPPSASAAPVAPIEIAMASVGDTMAFDKTAFSVPANATVHLVFKNNAKGDVLAHNWVLVNTGTEAKVAADGLAAGVAAGYLPSNNDDLLASTPLAPPGKTTETTFKAPKKPGTYPYICTFPGHYLMMKGVLTVTPPS